MCQVLANLNRYQVLPNPLFMRIRYQEVSPMHSKPHQVSGIISDIVSILMGIRYQVSAQCKANLIRYQGCNIVGNSGLPTVLQLARLRNVWSHPAQQVKMTVQGTMVRSDV